MLRSHCRRVAGLLRIVLGFSAMGSLPPAASDGPGFSELVATDIVVPNAGYLFVVDLDTGPTVAVARTPDAAVPPEVSRNGFFVHVNGNNDDWVSRRAATATVSRRSGHPASSVSSVIPSLWRPTAAFEASPTALPGPS